MLFYYSFINLFFKIDFIDRGTGVGLEPVIRIEIRHSDDPRDKLISSLFQSLGDSIDHLQFHYYNHKHIATKDGYDLEKQVLLFKPQPEVVSS